MIIGKAKYIALEWARLLEPYCERIEIAGGIRRGKPEVHDAELVAIPKAGHDMFGQAGPGLNMLEDFFCQTQTILKKNGPRYKQISLPKYEEFGIDLFIVLPPAQWGVIYTIRTGPAHFSRWLVTHRIHHGALPSFAEVKDGVVLARGEPQAMPEEVDFFNFCGLDWIEPAVRGTGKGYRPFTGGRT